MLKLFSSARSQEKVEMEASGGKPERKLSKKEMKSKSLSLPPGAVLMTHHGDGFFTKIRKYLRMKSKGKYDFNSHASPGRDSDGGSPVSLRSRGSRGTGSPINEHDHDQSLLRPNSSPVKIARRSQCDKEEVLLVRSDKRSSGGVHVTTRESAGSKEEVLVVTIEDSSGVDGEESAAGASASGLSPGSLSEDILDDTELDPDYETLDEVRRKVRATVCAQNAEGSTPETDVKNVSARQPLHVKAKANGDLSGRDSGFDNDSPFMGSPGSTKDHHPDTLSSSVPNSSALHSHRVPTLVVVNGAITLSTDPPAPLNNHDPMVTSSASPVSNHDPMVTSNASLNCANLTLEEDDLYSNAKVIIRKKSQKLSDSSFSSDADQRSSGLLVDRPQFTRNSITPADLLAIMEAESLDPSAPPPLPVRNYSADENLEILRLRREGMHRNEKARTDDDAEHVVLRSDTGHSSGARPKTFAGVTSMSRTSTVVEQGPILTISLPDPEATTPVQAPSREASAMSEEVDVPTPITPTTMIYEDMPVDNFYEDIPARTSGASAAAAPAPPERAPTFQLLPPEKKDREDDLAFIDDEDLSPGCEAPLADPESTTVDNSNSVNVASGATSTDMPEDVMIVSASDSMLGNDNEESHSHAGSDKHIVSSVDNCLLACVEECSVPAVASSGLGEQPDAAAQSTAGTGEGDLLTSHSVAHAAGEVIDITMKELPPIPSPNLNSPVSSSSSAHLSSVSGSVSSPSASASSTDTLNNVADTEGMEAMGDQDDWEGRDLNPPLSEPIHVSYRQLHQGLQTVPATQGEVDVNSPPPIPERRPLRRSQRDARSMDLSSSSSSSRSSGRRRHHHHRHSTSKFSSIGIFFSALVTLVLVDIQLVMILFSFYLTAVVSCFFFIIQLVVVI
jgi:hypothetical protein